MDWFSISLLCAFSLATADALTKKHLSGYSSGQMLLVRFSVPGLLLVPMTFIYPIPSVPLEFWGLILLLIPMELIAMSVYLRAIRDAPLYETLPYLSFTPVFNIFTGWIVLGESVSLIGAGGILLVVVGSYLLNICQLRDAGRYYWLRPLKAIFYQQGSRRMLYVAIIFSITSVVGKAAMQYTGPESFGAFFYIVLGTATLIVVTFHRPKDILVLKQNHLWHIAIGFLMAVMILTHFLAIAMVEAAYMITVKRTSLLFGILLGAWLLKEKDLNHHLPAAALMVGGVALILLI